jgi:hypothetical protein
MLEKLESQLIEAVKAGKLCYMREQQVVHTTVKGKDGKEYPVICVGHICRGNRHYMVVMDDVVSIRPFTCTFALAEPETPLSVKDGRPVFYGVDEVLEYLCGLVLC